MRSTAIYIFILLLMAAFPACSKKDESPLSKGKAAIPFELVSFDNKTLKITEGKPAVINFWASWCPPCKMEAPGLEKVYRDYGGKVDFIGITVQDNSADSLRFMKEIGLTFPSGPDNTGEVSAAYMVNGIPKTIIVDRKGRFSYIHMGVITEKKLIDELEKVL